MLLINYKFYLILKNFLEYNIDETNKVENIIKSQE